MVNCWRAAAAQTAETHKAVMGQAMRGDLHQADSLMKMDGPKNAPGLHHLSEHTAQI
jgi:hypothetical protein